MSVSLPIPVACNLGNALHSKHSGLQSPLYAYDLVWSSHSDQGMIPKSGLGSLSSNAIYSSIWPSGSRKKTEAAGIQQITLGSVVSTPKKESGLIPCVFRRFVAFKRSSKTTSNAKCRVTGLGAPGGGDVALPSDHIPSNERPESPILKNAAFCSGRKRRDNYHDLDVLYTQILGSSFQP